MRWLAVGLLAALSLSAYAQETASEEASAANGASQSALKRDMFVSIRAVKQFFPEVVRYRAEASPSVVGSPVGSGAVSYTSENSASKVILSVDEYENAANAQTAYQQAAQSSQRSDSSPIALSNIGQEVFGTTSTQNNETHIEIVALDGALIVGTRLTGYAPTTENIAKLASLAGEEVAQARAHAGRARRRR